MFRIRGAVLVVVAAVLAAGACGGTDWNAAHKAKTLSPAQLRAAAAAQKRAEVPFVNALVVKYAATGDGSTPADDICYANAVVHGFGVTSFTAHGLTPSGLRNRRTTLDSLPTPTLAQINAIGAGVQHCNLSTLGLSVGVWLGATDAPTVACVTRALDAPAARRFVGLAVLGRSRVDLRTAHNLIGVLPKCVDFAALIVRGMNLPAGSAIHDCVVTAIHGADAALKDWLSLKLSDGDPDQLAQTRDEVLVAINQCRAGAQTGFTVPAN
jgi:hypothetical protein